MSAAIGAFAPNEGSIGNFTRNESVSVGATAVNIAQPNPRSVYSIVNTSTGGQNITINLGFSQAVAGAGIFLSPGQAWVDSNGADYKCYQGPISAIASAAGGTVAIFER